MDSSLVSPWALKLRQTTIISPARQVFDPRHYGGPKQSLGKTLDRIIEPDDSLQNTSSSLALRLFPTFALTLPTMPSNQQSNNNADNTRARILLATASKP